MAWLLTLGLAAAVAILQTWLKVVSREPQPGKRYALTLDDAVFWIDWIVTAVIALCAALIGASLNHRPIGTATVFVALGVLFLGTTFMPFGVRMLCYNGSGVIKGWLYVVCADAIGMVVLLSSVVAGVKTYA